MQSDNDDLNVDVEWTLVSPPASRPASSSSRAGPDLELTSLPHLPASSNSSTNQQLIDDGLTEIDLTSSRQLTDYKPDEEQLSGRESCSSSRKSSLTQSELGEYVDFGQKPELDLIVENRKTDDISESETDSNGSSFVKIKSLSSPNLICLRAKLDELSEAVQMHHDDTSTLLDRPTAKKINLIITLLFGFSFLFAFSSIVLKKSDRAIESSPSKHKPTIDSSWSSIVERMKSLEYIKQNKLGDISTIQQQLIELQLLHKELTRCIQRQSPSSFKYYLSQDEHSRDAKHQPHKNPLKSYKGLVCYGQEKQWRARFDALRSDFNLDLRQLIQEAKKHITNEMLEMYHPALRFELILNQIEYLDFLREKQERKKSDEMIKFLKAENLQLLRRLNSPDQSHHQKLLVDLEMENSKLQRQISTLKTSLMEKAGPSYIRQALELEKFERQNSLLKQYHQEISQEIAKNLKHFNIHTVQPSSTFDDSANLSSQLGATRKALRRLSDKVSTILIENEGLKEELKDSYTLSARNNIETSPLHLNHLNLYNRDNNSNALSIDTCAKDLMLARDHSKHLEAQINHLKLNCCMFCSSELERSSSRDLDSSSADHHQFGDASTSRPLLSAPVTALDMRADNQVSKGKSSSEIHQDMLQFLTKLNDIQSNDLAVFSSLSSSTDQQQSSNMFSEDDKMKLTEDEMKVIPNYIREAIRVANKKVRTEIAQSTPQQNFHMIRLIEQLPIFKFWNGTSTNDKHLVEHVEIPVEMQHNISSTLMKNNQLEGNLKLDKQETREKLPASKLETVNWALKRAQLRERIRKVSFFFSENLKRNNNNKQLSYQQSETEKQKHDNKQQQYCNKIRDKKYKGKVRSKSWSLNRKSNKPLRKNAPKQKRLPDSSLKRRNRYIRDEF